MRISHVRKNFVWLFPDINGMSDFIGSLGGTTEGTTHRTEQERVSEEVIMRERDVERKLVNAVKAAGGICPKWVSPGFDGMPDRIVLMPGGKIAFVEVKAPGEKPRPLQLSRHKLLRRLGFKVFILDNIEKIGGIIDEIRTT